MEELIEGLLEILLELSLNKKIPLIIRIPLILLTILLYIAFILIILIIGIETYHSSKLGGILIMIIDVLILVLCIIAFKKTYLKKKC